MANRTARAACAASGGTTGALAGAVLTGGASRRMGTDKALMEVDGVPMAARVAAAIRAVGCEPLVLVGGDAHGLATLGEELVVDEHPGEGPLGAVATTLRWATGIAELVFITSCDLAHLGSASGDLRALVRAAVHADDVDVVVARSHRIEPLCAVWRTAALAAVERMFASGERSMHAALSGLRVQEMPVDPRALRNINTPDDLVQ